MKENFGIAVLAILCGLMIVVLVFGMVWVFTPSSKEAVKETSLPEDRFIKIQDWRSNFTFYDKETKVQYYATPMGVVVLVDVDGKPLLYEGE